MEMFVSYCLKYFFFVKSLNHLNLQLSFPTLEFKKKDSAARWMNSWHVLVTKMSPRRLENSRWTSP